MMGGSFAVCALGGCGSFAGCALGGYQSHSLRQLICRAATHPEAGKKHVEAGGREEDRSGSNRFISVLKFKALCVGIWVGSLRYIPVEAHMYSWFIRLYVPLLPEECIALVHQ